MLAPVFAEAETGEDQKLAIWMRMRISVRLKMAEQKQKENLQARCRKIKRRQKS